MICSLVHIDTLILSLDNHGVDWWPDRWRARDNPLVIDYPGPLVQSGPQISIFTVRWSSSQVQSSPQINGYRRW